MARPRADVGETKLLQKLPDIARMKVDPEPLNDDALEIDPPPAHDAIFLPIRANFHDLRECGHLLFRQPRLRTFGPVVQEPVGPEALKR